MWTWEKLPPGGGGGPPVQSDSEVELGGEVEPAGQGSSGWFFAPPGQ